MSMTRTGATGAILAPLPSGEWRELNRLGHYVVFGGLGLFALWASFARLDGAAIAPGLVAAEGNRKTIQHLEGGIVQDVLVRDGMQVKANQLLIRLDPTRLDTQSDLFRNQLAILQAQEARLMAEYEQKPQLDLPDTVMSRAGEPAVAPVIADQRRLFQARRDAVQRNTQIADAQIEQARREHQQTRVDIATSQSTLQQVDAELESLKPLFKRQLVPMTRIAPLERERLRLSGIVETGSIQLSKLNEKIEEITLKRQQVLQDYSQEASTALLDVRKQLSDVRQQILLAADGQKRAEIRAPIDGTVQQLKVFTVGGVVRPGDALMDIAPLNDELIIRAKVAPNDADRVVNGMTAEIKFPSFNYWGTNVIRGTVRSMSRDRITEDGGRDVYFAADVVVDKGTVPEEILPKLSAGLSAEVVITTGERTVANYLLKPLFERMNRGMRER
jgi:HlyD family type I secretion membrane fusion protein